MARRRKRRPAPTLLGRALRAARTAALLFVGLSVLWVLWYRFAPVTGTTQMGLRQLQGQTIDRDWTPITEMSPHLVRAVIAAEDTGFCAHHGIDVEGIKKALGEAEGGGRLRGASTISQQTAKNAFLWSGRGPVRKGLELWFTGLEELIWPKRRIMEVYLNVAEWGDGHFGAEAAAQARFGKPASALTATEASLLAAVLPSPQKWRVDPPGPYVASRARTLRARMATVRRSGLADCVLD